MGRLSGLKKGTVSRVSLDDGLDDFVFPHCEARILHAPGVCKFCDMNPSWQQLRVFWGINFTGENEEGLLPCPADFARGETHSSWDGNVARDWNGQPVVPPPADRDVRAAAKVMLGILEESNE